MKLTLQNYVDFLFHHVQENTSVDNPWITIKTRDVPEITGCSNHYVRRVLDGLKNHPRVIGELDMDASPIRKPFRFKVVSEEEKMEYLFDENSFKYLSGEEIKYVTEQIGEVSLGEKGLLLHFINFLVGMGADKEPISMDAIELSKILAEPPTAIRDRAMQLKKADILVGSLDKGKYMIALSVRQLNRAKVVVLRNYDEVSQLLSSEDPKERLEGLLVSSDPLKSEKSIHELVTQMKVFQDFFQTKLDEVISYKQEVKHTEESYEASQRILEENTQIVRYNDELRQENDQLRMALEKRCQANDVFIRQAQQTMELMSAEIMGLVKDFSLVPSWNQNEKTGLALQAKVAAVMTNAIQELVGLKSSA